jgi:hypothetical protein
MASPSLEPIPLTVKDWVTKATANHKFDLQKHVVRFLLPAYGALLAGAVLAGAVLIYLLQGFALWGFNLSEMDLKFVGGATIGCIGGLLTLTFRTVFR